MHLNFLILLTTLSLMLGVAESIVCTPDICASVQCLAVENCDGPNKVVKPGGYCQCCNLCHTILSENEACSSITKFLTGAPPPLVECGQGLICHGGKCKSFKSLSQTYSEK